MDKDNLSKNQENKGFQVLLSMVDVIYRGKFAPQGYSGQNLARNSADFLFYV